MAGELFGRMTSRVVDTFVKGKARAGCTSCSPHGRKRARNPSTSHSCSLSSMSMEPALEKASLRNVASENVTTGPSLITGDAEDTVNSIPVCRMTNSKTWRMRSSLQVEKQCEKERHSYLSPRVNDA